MSLSLASSIFRVIGTGGNSGGNAEEAATASDTGMMVFGISRGGCLPSSIQNPLRENEHRFPVVKLVARM